MKMIFRNLALTICWFFLGSYHIAYAFTAGDKVCIQWSDWLWYQGEVTEVNTDEKQIMVHYTGYDHSWDEWVKEGSARTLPIHTVGDKVLAFWKESLGKLFWHEASVIATSSKDYKIHYTSDGNDTTWDEWVEPCRLISVPQIDDPLWVSPSSSTWAVGKIVAHSATDIWKVHYGGYSSWGTWIEYDDTFSPPNILPPTADEKKNILTAFEEHAPAIQPSGKNVYSYSAVSVPVLKVTTPSKIKPIGIGDAATGGSTINISFETPPFRKPVNIYFGVEFRSSNDIYIYKEDGSFQSFDQGLVPCVSQNTSGATKKVLSNFPLSSLTPEKYYFYLLVAKDSSLSDYYLWTTSYGYKQAGIYTGETTQCTTSEISSLITPIIQNMESHGATTWYNSLKSYVSNYKNSDGSADPKEAYEKIMIAAYGANNVYPFCWAALKAAGQDPTDTWALNNGAVCLLELNETDKAGKLLDCAALLDPDLSITHGNGAAYFAKKGNPSKAVNEMKKTVQGQPTFPHSAWDGYHYAAATGQTAQQSNFLSSIPANYSLKNNDGTTGTGKKELVVCCNCNGSIYRDLGLCLDECNVTLACFTHICSPRLDCCDGKGPFSFEGGLCYPPKGLQVCIETDTQGNVAVKAGVDLGNIFTAYVGASSNFSNNHNIFVEGAGVGSKVKTTILTTDPNTKNWSSEHQVFVSGGGKGVGFSVNSTPSNWSKSLLCELYPSL